MYHFGTRDALVTAVVETALARFREEVMRHVDLAENRPGKLLRGYVRALCGSSDEAVAAFAPTAWNGIHTIPDVARLLEADAHRWRDDFSRDSIDPDRALVVQFAAEGVAAAVALGVYIDHTEITRARAAILQLAEP
jgi:AcrR family transcriptional regulator